MGEQLSPPLRWLKWRVGSLWPYEGLSLSLTPADTELFLAALTQLDAESGISSVSKPSNSPEKIQSSSIEPKTVAPEPVQESALSGTVVCTLIRAEGLASADTFSETDCYCKLSLVDQKNAEGEEDPQNQTSTTIENNNNPLWGQKFNFRVENITDCSLRHSTSTQAGPIRSPPRLYDLTMSFGRYRILLFDEGTFRDTQIGSVEVSLVKDLALSA